MVDDLKMIKKMYGEKMMHLCRELFPTILEVPGLLYSLMEENFAPNHHLYDDIVEEKKIENFKNYICSLQSSENKKLIVTKTPQELMDEAGYILYECKSEEDIQEFEKYYKKGEELCTFNGGRLSSCYVFFAVKKNVNEIRRYNFFKPERQDEYGTSVISIQFTRGDTNTLSIKNRYNHKVNNPDATFSNNLDNIIPGLTASFEKTYGLNINQNGYLEFEINGYVKASDGRYYKCNFERNNIYYCQNNIIIDNFEVIRDYQEKEKYIIADYFIIDLVKKEVRLYDSSIADSFVDGFDDIKKIEVVRNKENSNKVIIITPNEGSDIIIEIDKFNQIISYKNNNLVNIIGKFLCKNTTLKRIELSNVLSIGNDFLCENCDLERIELPNVLNIGNSFLCENSILLEIYLPNVLSIGNNFLECNESLEKIELPKVENIGSFFLCFNESLCDIIMPKVRELGRNFLSYIEQISVFDLPKLESVGDGFLGKCKTISKFKLPSLKIAGNDFMYSANLKIISFPKLEVVGTNFLCDCTSTNRVYLPNLRKVGYNFLFSSKNLKRLKLLKLKSVGKGFLSFNSSLEFLSLPELEIVGDEFLASNSTLLELDLPKLREIGNRFMVHNNSLLSANLPKLKTIGNHFLLNNRSLNVLDTPDLETVGDYFMYNNQYMSNFNAPNLESVGSDFLVNNIFYETAPVGKIRKR